jgi:hypothetical protein
MIEALSASVEGNNSKGGGRHCMEVKDDLGRVNSSTPRVTSALRIYAPPELAISPRLPIMATQPSHQLQYSTATSSLSPGPVRASVGTIRGLYSFVPRVVYSTTVQPQPPFVYLQRTDDNMSSDLEWHLLRVPETIFNTLLQLTLL